MYSARKYSLKLHKFSPGFIIMPIMAMIIIKMIIKIIMLIMITLVVIAVIKNSYKRK